MKDYLISVTSLTAFEQEQRSNANCTLHVLQNLITINCWRATQICRNNNIINKTFHSKQE